MDKKVLIIGGNSGIGKKIFEYYSRDQFTISVSKSGINSNQLSSIPENLKKGINFLSEKDTNIFFNTIENLKLNFDLVIISAGVYTPELNIRNINSDEYISDASQNTIINLNIIKNIHRIAYSNSVVIIFLGGGIGGNLSADISSTYIMSKLSLITFIEHFPHNLIEQHVVGVSPGFFDTGFSKPVEININNEQQEINKYKKLFYCLDLIHNNPIQFCGRAISAQNDSIDFLKTIDNKKTPLFGKFRRVY